PSLLAGSGEPGTPLAFSLEADGQSGDANLQGELRRGDLHAVVQPSRLRLREQVLELHPLVVDVFEGRITATGRGDFSRPDDGDFRFTVEATGLRFGGQPAAPDPQPADPAPAIGVDAALEIAGRSADWTVSGTGDIRRDDLRASIELDGRGDLDRLVLRTLRAQAPGGALEANGEVAWAPALAWDIQARMAGFDPGYFVSGWDGAVDGRLAGTGRQRADGGIDLQGEASDLGGSLRGRPLPGQARIARSAPGYFVPGRAGAVDGRLAGTGRQRADGGIDLRVEASDLGGSLRGRRLSGQARFAMQGASASKPRNDFEGTADLGLGDSRVQAEGRLDARVELDARFAPLQLADLLPDAAGSLRGTLRARGPRQAPDVEADLQGSGLRWAGYGASSLTLRGRL